MVSSLENYHKIQHKILNCQKEIRDISIRYSNIGSDAALRNGEINLPSIIVIGDQSSGKSSVIESLAGVSYFFVYV